MMGLRIYVVGRLRALLPSGFAALFLLIGQASGQEILLKEFFYPENLGGGISGRYEYYEDDQSQEVRHGFFRLYTQAGTLQNEGFFADGVPTGTARTWNADGELTSQGSYVNGLRDGEWNYWFYDNPSQLFWRVSYALGQKHGVERQWLSDGTLSKETHWANGLNHGPLREWHNAGTLKLYEEWDQGERTSQSQYRTTGEIIVEGHWLNGLKHGAWVRYAFLTIGGETRNVVNNEEDWEQGIQKSSREYQYHAPFFETSFDVFQILEDVYLNGGVDHRIVQVYASEVLRERYREVAGIKHGTSETWWPNGNQASRYIYDTGLIHGDATTWYESGQLRQSMSYANGKRSGSYTERYESGAIFVTATYVGGDLTGQRTTFFAGGDVLEREFFANGKLHGPAAQTTYNASGGVSKVADYRLGLLHGAVVEMGPKLSINIMSIRYYKETDDDEPTGDFPMGGDVTKVTTHYVNGLKHGIEHGEYEDGVSAYIRTWAYGERNGPYVEYTPRAFVAFLNTSPRQSLTYDAGFIVYSGISPCGPRSHLEIKGLDALYKTSPVNPDCIAANPPLSAFPDLPATPAQHPEPGKIFTTIHGGVLDESGVETEGVSIQIIADQTDVLTTDANGRYSLIIARADEPRTISVRASRDGYETWFSGDIPLSQGQSMKAVNIRMEPLGHEGPSIQRFGPSFLGNRSSFGGIFLDTPILNVDFVPQVDWGDASPDQVRLIKNGDLIVLSGAVYPIKQTYTIPNDFHVSLDPSRNIITAQAIDTAGKSSKVETIHPVVLPVPLFLQPLLIAPVAFAPGATTDKVTYVIKATLPEEPIEGLFTSDIAPTPVWAAWSLVPFVGGEDIGLSETQIEMELGLSSTAEGSFKGTLVSGFEIAGVNLGGSGGVSGAMVYDAFKGWELNELAMELGIQGGVSREAVVSEAITPLKTAKSLPVVGGIVRVVDDIARLEGTFSVLGGGKLGGHKVNGYVELFGEMSFGAGLGLDAKIELGGATFTAGGSGQVVATVQAPPNPDYLKSIDTSFTLKGVLGWKVFEVGGDTTWTFSYPTTVTVQGVNGPSRDSGPATIRLISRGFAAKANYHQFTGGQRIQKQGATAPVEQTLIANAYADAEPAFALNGAAGAIVYVHFDENKPTLQATDIHLLYSADGTFAQAPVPVTDDTRGEFAPTIGFDANGRLVAAWERVKSANFTTDDIAAFAADLEIVYASYDPTAGTWNAPVALTDNAALDHSPEICRGLNGEILLVWRQNTGLELIGTADSPTTIFTANWDAAARTFNAPEAAPHSFVDANGFSCAFDGDDFLLVWSRDTDGDAATSDDFEIEYLTRNGATWGSVVALTDDAVKDVSPKVIYKAADQPELLWVRDGMLVRLTDWMTKTPAEVRADSGGLSFLDYDLLCDANNRLVTLWSAMDEQGQPNVFYQARDAAADQWSMDRQLTHDEAVEFNLRGALAPDGSFRYVYLSKHPANDVADLIIRTHRISANLSVGAADIKTDPERPAPNEAVTLKATVHNTGDLPASGITVAFHDGDPSVNTTPVGTAMLPATFRAGDSVTVSVNWTAPASLEGVNIWVVVDNGNALIESDETDNQAMAPLALPDLVVTDIRYSDLNDGSVLLYTTVENIGGVTADVIPIRYLIDGVEYATTTLNRLFPGRNAEFSNRIYGDALFANDIVGGQIEVVVNPDKTLAEYENSDDNRRAIRVHLESDLDQDGMNDQWERLHFGDTLRDGLGDLDNDGMPDRAEYVAGTDPNQATSAIYFGAPNRNPQTGHVHLTWATSPGRTYQAQYTDDLGSQNWQNLGQPFTSSATSSDMTDTNPAAGGQRYYRVVVVGSQP